MQNTTFSLSKGDSPPELTQDEIGEVLAGAYRYLHLRVLELEAAERAAAQAPAEVVSDGVPEAGASELMQ